MKKNLLFLLSVIGFMLLFYKQSVGLNLLLFNILLLAFVFVSIPKARESKSIWILSIGALITSASAAWYADWSSIFLNILTLMLLPVFLHQKMATILFAETFGIWNVISSPIRLIRDRKFDKSDSSQNLLMKRVLLYGLLPFIVFVLFFYLYRQINPVWGDYMWKMIGYVFSWSFVFLLLLAILLMYAFWYFVKSPGFNQFLIGKRNELAPTSQPTFKNIPLSMEMWSGVLLFALLNLLLFSLLATDFQQLIIEKKIPEGYTLSEYLHKGVYAVIASIIFAIALLVFYFKGAFNYYKKGKFLRILAWIWIAFNVVLILFTFYKNILYVEAYDLTFKRVSVFIYLLLCWVGLYFTTIKLRFRKTFVYIVRKMYWAFYIMWVLTTPVNWTNCITSYNLEHAKQKNYKGESIDIHYLTDTYQLNELNIRALYSFLENNPENPYAVELKKGLDAKYLQVIKSDNKRKWRGSRLYDKYIKKYLAKQNYKPFYAEIDDAKYYPELLEVKNLIYNFHYANDKKESELWLAELLQYKNVESLDLRGRDNFVQSLKVLEPMKSLKKLNLHPFYTNRNFKIEGLSQLDTLQISVQRTTLDIGTRYSHLKFLDISGTQLSSIYGWENVPALEHLEINANDMEFLNISVLRNLRQLNLYTYGMKNLKMANRLAKMQSFLTTAKKIKSFKRLPDMPNLQVLNMDGCKLKKIDGVEKFPNLEMLSLTGNTISSIKEIAKLKHLKVLDLSNNKIVDISPLKDLQLQELYVKGNRIADLTPLYALLNLRILQVGESLAPILDKSKLPSDIKLLDYPNETDATQTVVVEAVERVSDNATLLPNQD